MPNSEPVAYEDDLGIQYNMLATIRRAPGIRREDLDPEDAGVENTVHLVAMRLSDEVAARIPEGHLALILETAASRILNENFGISDCGHFDIDYRHATVEDIAEANPPHVHEDVIGAQDFEDAGIAPLGDTAPLDDPDQGGDTGPGTS